MDQDNYDKCVDGLKRARAATQEVKKFYFEEVLGFPVQDKAKLAALLEPYKREPTVAYINALKARQGDTALIKGFEQRLRAEVEAMEAIELPETFGSLLRDVQYAIEDRLYADPRILRLIQTWKQASSEWMNPENGNMRFYDEAAAFFFERRTENPTDPRPCCYISPAGRNRLDACGLKYGEILYYMNRIVRATFQAWQDCTGHTAPYPRFTYMSPPASFPLQNSFSVVGRRDKKGACCFVHKRAMLTADITAATEVARHESEHVFQWCVMGNGATTHRLAGLKKSPLYLQKYLSVTRYFASQIFGALDPTVLDDLSYRAYHATPSERMAHMAGYFAALRFSQQHGMALPDRKREPMQASRPFMEMLTPSERAHVVGGAPSAT